MAMVKDSVRERIKITKSGKFLRRRMAQGHFRARKSSRLIRRKRELQRIGPKDLKSIKKYL